MKKKQNSHWMKLKGLFVVVVDGRVMVVVGGFVVVGLVVVVGGLVVGGGGSQMKIGIVGDKVVVGAGGQGQGMRASVGSVVTGPVATGERGHGQHRGGMVIGATAFVLEVTAPSGHGHG